ncbi:hypothetical protein E3N88_18270 [Mikania micrantha]|uniref:Integrase catalytic domain-containing protein n=1 Tax=Mikania micrantha TaxID=192012 RepID=A0A5N6NUT4_9ASTR|nr:hypothetical protein E3N88_18270 [Mikania micrantha]
MGYNSPQNTYSHLYGYRCLLAGLLALADDVGYGVSFGGGQWKIKKGNLVIAKGIKRGTLYMADVHADGVNFVTPCPTPSDLWHKLLGHMSVKGIKMLAAKGKFPDLKTVETGFCESCVKCLKSDNGGEYVSTEFTNYCADHGIKMIKTVPETPQQNGVAERMNRTLNERARSMRLSAGLPKTFWDDAVNIATYLINHGPSIPLLTALLLVARVKTSQGVTHPGLLSPEHA